MSEINQTIHLVGSVPLPSTNSVFVSLCDAFHGHLKRIPDGETGERGSWIRFQRQMLLEHAAIDINSAGRSLPIIDLEGNLRHGNDLLSLDPAVDPDQVSFCPLGYAAAALNSYQTFKALKTSGAIDPSIRFQVALPTPFATGLFYVEPASQPTFIEVMKRDLMAELAEICASIPHGELSIQWDCCQEILLLEGYFPDDWTYNVDNLPPILGQLGDAVPAGVELGYHLCYGSPVDAPLVKQQDMRVAATLAQAIVDAAERPVNFMHLPVSDPNARQPFFEPLRDLRFDRRTEIYLGLVHPKDPQHNRERITAAEAVLPEFGLSTECGWGRKTPEALPHLLQTHREALALRR